jgi:transposase
MQIDKIAVQSSIAQRIRSIDGFGPICSSTLAGELGNIDRFASESSLALYCGMTRLNNDSGVSTGSKNTRQVNTHARSVMMIGVARHIDAIRSRKLTTTRSDPRAKPITKRCAPSDVT